MTYVVCAEEMDGRWIAHVPDLPGCFSGHTDREVALKAIPGVIEDYIGWCHGHGLRLSGFSGPMIVTEVIRAWDYEEGQEVNAFFASDRPPLLREELPEFDILLQATRQDLLAQLSGLDGEQLQRELHGERWSVDGILNHIADAEWWYLDRLGLAISKASLPDETLDRLEAVRRHLDSQMEALCGRTGVVTLAGETWSGRKVMRRALWHERDHTQHIGKIKPRLG
jgi:predicted RNase H-like HicB family nuclease